jgi:hypothetical protein
MFVEGDEAPEIGSRVGLPPYQGKSLSSADPSSLVAYRDAQSKCTARKVTCCSRSGRFRDTYMMATFNPPESHHA